MLPHLVRVELHQLTVVRLWQSKQGGMGAAGCSSVGDVTHAKEEAHLTHHLQQLMS